MKELYGKLLQYDGKSIIIADKEFESTICFQSCLDDLRYMLSESTEYFSDSILISVYHYIITGEVAEASQIVGSLESHITGRGAYLDTEYAKDLVDNGFEWSDLDIEEQIEDIASVVSSILKLN